MKIRDKNEFADLYVNQQWSVRRIAIYYDTCTSTVHYYIKRNNITRPRCNYDTGVPAKSVLARLYVENRMTLVDISKKYAVSSATVMNWLKRHQIPRRKGGAMVKFPKPSKAELENKYIKQNWEQGRIAYHYGCSINSVQRWLREYEIRKYVRSAS